MVFKTKQLLLETDNILNSTVTKQTKTAPFNEQENLTITSVLKIL